MNDWVDRQMNGRGEKEGMRVTLNHCAPQVCMAKPDPKGVAGENGSLEGDGSMEQRPLKGTVTYGRDPEGIILFHVCSRGVEAT